MWRCSGLQILFVAAATLTAGTTMAQATAANCGSLDAPQGDYVTNRTHLQRVEGPHFTPEVEALLRGKSTTDIGGDIDYTLRAFPNHHRALVSMARLAEKLKKDPVPGAMYRVECYFERALRFSRDDMVARILYASYLAKMKRDNEARAHLKIAAAASEDNPFTQYNIGLVFLEMKDYENALLQAHRAQDMGFPRTQLRQELIAAGRWRDPSPPSKADAVPAGGASR